MPDTPQGLWPDDEYVPSQYHGDMFRMPNGQEYVVSSTLLAMRPDLLKHETARLTQFISERPEEQPVMLFSDNIELALSRPEPPFSDRAFRLMKALRKRLNGRPGVIQMTRTYPDQADLRRASLLLNADHFRALLVYLRDRGLIELHETSSSIGVKVPVASLIAMEQDERHEDSQRAFVAMWFDAAMTEIYDQAIAPAIADNGFEPFRIDKTEHNNKIDDEIIAGIRRSRFLVADFSCGDDGARGGVYYEAGFAAGLGKPVIYMVRASDLGRVHFDTRQINHIVWDGDADLREKLFNRIAATIV